MTKRRGVPVRQRRVSTELRELRRDAGLTCADVARALGTSITKISRMETGERGLYADDVAAMLGLYRVPAKRREELLGLVRNGAEPNWWQHKMAPVPPAWRDLISLESTASAIFNFQPLLVPGLLQTSEYAAEVISGCSPKLSESAASTLVATRMARQALLTRRHAPSLRAIIDEMALRRPIGAPGVMHRQLQHLLACSERPNVTLQVLPFAVGATPGLQGSFIVMDFNDGPSVLHLEAAGGGGFLSDESSVQTAKFAARHMAALALTPERSRRLIADLASETG